MIGTTFAPANNLVGHLVGLGILEEATGYARNRRFRYEPYIRLIGEESPKRQLMTDGLKPYPAYKDSGVPWLGEVSEHWEVHPNISLRGPFLRPSAARGRGHQ